MPQPAVCSTHLLTIKPFACRPSNEFTCINGAVRYPLFGSSTFALAFGLLAKGDCHVPSPKLQNKRVFDCAAVYKKKNVQLFDTNVH